jgi:hypothetical protein
MVRRPEGHCHGLRYARGAPGRHLILASPANALWEILLEDGRARAGGYHGWFVGRG